MDINFEEIEFAGGMAVRFMTIETEDYDADDMTFTETEAGLSRIQNVLVSVLGGDATHGFWSEEDGELWFGNDGGELGIGDDVEARLMVIGRQ